MKRTLSAPLAAVLAVALSGASVASASSPRAGSPPSTAPTAAAGPSGSARLAATERARATQLTALIQAEGVQLAKLSEVADQAGVRAQRLDGELRAAGQAAQAARARLGQTKALLLTQAVEEYTSGDQLGYPLSLLTGTRLVLVAGYEAALGRQMQVAIDGYTAALAREQASVAVLASQRRLVELSAKRLSADRSAAARQQAVLKATLKEVRGELAVAVAIVRRQQQVAQIAEEKAMLASAHQLPPEGRAGRPGTSAVTTTAATTTTTILASTTTAATTTTTILASTTTTSAPSSDPARTSTIYPTTPIAGSALSTGIAGSALSTGPAISTVGTPGPSARLRARNASGAGTGTGLVSTASMSAATPEPTEPSGASSLPSSRRPTSSRSVTPSSSTTPGNTTPSSTTSSTSTTPPSSSTPPSSTTTLGATTPTPLTAPTTTSTTTVPAGSGAAGAPASGWQTAVAFAESQLGKPYQWAGSGPNSYDCSGLTMVAWSRAGVLLPHSAQDQYNMTARVAIGHLLPGDMVFFGTPSDVYHVGIYIGGGKMVDAPETGENVSIQPIYWTNLLGGGRV